MDGSVNKCNGFCAMIILKMFNYVLLYSKLIFHRTFGLKYRNESKLNEIFSELIYFACVCILARILHARTHTFKWQSTSMEGEHFLPKPSRWITKIQIDVKKTIFLNNFLCILNKMWNVRNIRSKDDREKWRIMDRDRGSARRRDIKWKYKHSELQTKKNNYR